EQVRSFKRDMVHALALEFIELEASDREQLRLFISQYETELANTLLTDEPGSKDVEITDPQTIMAALKRSDENVLFEPLTLDDYRRFYLSSEEIEKILAEKQNAPISPLQLLLMESLEKLSADERQWVDQLLHLVEPELIDKVMLNLFFMRIKL